MALSRRPARFKRPDFMKIETISREKLELLRAAAARVYINKQNPSDKSSEVETDASGCANVKEEPDFDDGMQLLAAAATQLSKEWGKKGELGVEKKLKQRKISM